MRIASTLVRSLAVATASVLAVGVVATSASAAGRPAIAIDPAPAAVTVETVSDDTDLANQDVTVTGTAAPGADIAMTASSAYPSIVLSPKAPITTGLDGTWTAHFDATPLSQGTFTVVATATADGTQSNYMGASKDTVDFALLRTSPSADGTGSAHGPLLVELNEPIKSVYGADPSSVTLADDLGTAVPGYASTAGPDSSVLMFTPYDPLEAGRSYTATAHAVESGAGADPAIDTTFTFAVDANLPATPRLDYLYPSQGRSVYLYGTAPADTDFVLTATDSATPAGVATHTFHADSNGNIGATLDTSTLSDGLVTVVATATAGPDGPVSNPSNALSFTKNSAPYEITDLAATDTSADNRTTTITGRVSRPGSSLSVGLSDGNGGSQSAYGLGTDADGTFSFRTDSAHVKDGAVTVYLYASFAPEGDWTYQVTTFTNGSSVGPPISDQKATETTREQPVSTVTGVTTPGAVVTLTRDYSGTPVGSATADDAGAFSMPVDETGLQTGNVYFNMTAALPDGPTGPNASTYNYRVNGPTITDLVATPVTSDTPTSTISGTVGEADAGSTIAFDLYDPTNKHLSASAVAGPDGSFSTDVDLTDFADGNGYLYAVATDTNGGAGPYEYSSFIKDTVTPQVASLDATSTTSSSPYSVVTGTVSGGSDYYYGYTNLAISAVDHLGGTTETTTYAYDYWWESAPADFYADLDLSSLADGPITITVTPSDGVGNTGTPVQTTVTKDTSGPAVTGLSATPTNSADPTTTVTGNTMPGASVTVSAAEGDYSASADPVYADDSGNFTAELDLTGFPDGPVPVTAVATDPGTGDVGPSAETTSARHTAGPAITDLAATAVTFATHGSTVTGNTAPGATVDIAATDSADNVVTGTATADDSGAFSAVLDLSELVAGDVTVTAAATDADGATGALATTTTTTEGPAVTITTQPEDQSTPSGSSVTFTAAGAGTPTPTVQWQRSTDGGDSFANLLGATDPSLTVNADYADTGYEYRAVFTNENGTATTRVATLTVTATPPVITLQPTGQTVAPGSVVSFHADAVGDPMPTVQWQVSRPGGRYRDIAGATSNDYVMSASSAVNGYRYRAVFTNPGNSVTTSAALLTVTSPPAPGGGGAGNPGTDGQAPPPVVSPSESPSASPSASPSSSTPASPSGSTPASRKPLTLSVLTPEIPAGSAGTLVATGAANEAYSLQCYTRPSTSYTEAKHGVFDAAGDPVTFTLHLGRNTRCFVQYVNDSSRGASAAAVIRVRTVLSLSAVRTAVGTYTFQGTNLPRVAGQLITLYRVDAAGHEIRTANLSTDDTGVFRVTRRFTGTGTFRFLVRTSTGLNNAAGASNVITVTIR
ncbi:MAG: glycoside hydrolase family 9 [Frankiales bacterium]|nr:glycoside hydrolase family 9 [Frankiales bacterium]